ncbi:sulfite exporter TauE/SafE family protein [soil metagenome]
MTFELQLLLAAISFLAGVGITSIGPGGILLTIALYSLTTLAPAEVAGTASVTFIVTGLLGTLIYARSGQLRNRGTRRMAWMLSGTSIAGALAGAWANPWLSPRLFGLLLGIASAVAGAVIIRQTWRGLTPRAHLDSATRSGRLWLAVLGFGIGFTGGLLGVGGPVLAVPALVVLGVPLLCALAMAQVQSIFVATFATLGFVLQGAVLWPLALSIGLPQLIGAFLGWRIAHRVPAARLKLVLGAALFVLGSFLIF